MRYLIYTTILFLLLSCGDNKPKETIALKENTNSVPLFSKIPHEKSGLNFKNILKQDLGFNFISYPNILSGAGVGAGDIENDGGMDLIVTSAGYEMAVSLDLMSDRVYINDATGSFTKVSDRIPYSQKSTKVIIKWDFDNDGDEDLFIGGSVLPGKYPLSERSFVLRNDNGVFIDVTNQSFDELNFGIVTDVQFSDIDNGDDLDLIVVGEWTGVKIFENTNGNFEKRSNGLDNRLGWWQSCKIIDIDGDGDFDILAGNLGKNNKFQPSEEKPIYIYSKDFDSNGSYDVALTKMNNGEIVPIRGKECSSEQNPFLLDEIESYKDFANLNFQEIYGEERLYGAEKLKVNNFETTLFQNTGDFNFKAISLSNQA